MKSLAKERRRESFLKFNNDMVTWCMLILNIFVAHGSTHPANCFEDHLGSHLTASHASFDASRSCVPDCIFTVSFAENKALRRPKITWPY